MDDDTPKRPLGLTPSEREYDIVSRGLVALAEEAKRSGQTDAYAALKRFVVRLKQHTYAGKGVPDETLERMTKVIDASFARQDYEDAKVGVAALLAAVIRMDPDPAHVIALQLAPSFVQLTVASAAHHQNKIGSGVLRRLAQRLESDREAFETDGWSDPPTTFDYVRELVEFCAVELDNGVDPFETLQDSSN